MHFVDLEEIHAFCFIARDFKTIFQGPFQYLVNALLHFSFYGDNVFRTVTNEEVVDI